MAMLPKQKKQRAGVQNVQMPSEQKPGNKIPPKNPLSPKQKVGYMMRGARSVLKKGGKM